MLRFLHTSDVHLGRAFGYLGPHARKQQERLAEAFLMTCKLGRENKCDLMVIAGDLFDSNRIAQHWVRVALDGIQEFGVPVVVIPGNHDPALKHPFSSGNLPSNLHWLSEDTIYQIPSLEMSIHTKHPPDLQRTGRPFEIALLHGSIAGGLVPPTVDTLALNDLNRSGMDYIALGDWHSLSKQSDNIYYSGSPEMVMPNQALPGSVLIVELDKGSAQVSPLTTGKCRRLSDEHIELDTFETIEALIGKIGSFASDEVVARIVLEGKWNGKDSLSIDDIESELAGRYLSLQIESKALSYGDASAEGLLAGTFKRWIEEREEEPDIRQEALQLGLHLLQGGRI